MSLSIARSLLRLPASARAGTSRHGILAASSAPRSFATSSTIRSELLRTPLYPFHVKPDNGAKMVPFAGYEMPLNYEKSGGQVTEHLACRSGAGFFDVSHMVQHTFTGPSSTAFLSRLLPSPLSTMAPYTASLSVLMNEEGGIIDDCMITRWGEESWYLVTNAGRRVEDLAWIERHLAGLEEGQGVRHEVLENYGLVALQGPSSATILQPLLTPDPAAPSEAAVDLTKVTFGQSIHAHLNSVPVHIARGGYTGEDGFEISLPPKDSLALTELLASQAGVTLTGLAARDSLRLEAGLCLYGHDLDESVGTAEAALGWTVGKQRTGFFGEARTRGEKGDAIKRRRVGLVVQKGPPAREGAKIFTEDGEQEVGTVTSGIPSPTLGKNIAMGYVSSGHHKKGTKLIVEVRGKKREAEVVKMPFVEAKYFRGA